MRKNEKIEIEEGWLILSNGLPVSFGSPLRIGVDGIRELEMRIAGRLGHPVVFLELHPCEKGGCEGDIFHPDSVMIRENACQDSAYPFKASKVLGLWNGADVSDLCELLSETRLIGDHQRSQRFAHSAIVSLRSQRLSLNESRRLKMGLERSRRYTYFRDQSRRGLLYFDGVAVKCPDTSRLITAMKLMGGCHYGQSFVDRHSDELRELGCELITEPYHEAE